MTMGEAIITCFRKIFVYRGRARRSEYWYFYLFIILVNIVFGILERVFPTTDVTSIGIGDIIALVTLPIALAVILASIAVSVRRLHDLNWSGYWLLVPVILGVLWGLAVYLGHMPDTLNTIFMLVFLGITAAITIAMAIRGTDGTNKYGTDPLDEIPERHVFD